MIEHLRPGAHARDARVVLFDFDGTLADSFEAITASTNHIRQTY